MRFLIKLWIFYRRQRSLVRNLPFRMLTNTFFNRLQVGKYLDYKVDCFYKIGNNVVIRNNCNIQTTSLYIGNRTRIGKNCSLYGSVVIADSCLVSSGVVFAGGGHGTLSQSIDFLDQRDQIPKPIEIGRNVWIGANAVILDGVSVGANSIVGAAAVVTKDVPENSIVVGQAACVLKQ